MAFTLTFILILKQFGAFLHNGFAEKKMFFLIPDHNFGGIIARIKDMKLPIIQIS